MEKIKKRIANLKVAGKLKSISNDSACYDIIFSVSGTDLDISDPFKYREDHGGLVSGIGRSAGVGNNDCEI